MRLSHNPLSKQKEVYQVLPVSAACGGTPWRHVAVGGTPSRRIPPDHQTAHRRAAPAAHMRPRPAGRTTPTQETYPRAKQTAGARRVRPRTSQQNFLFCAPVCGLVHKTPILLIWLVGPRRRAAQSNPRGFGGRDPRSPAVVALDLWGGTTTPPHGCFVLCAKRKPSKKIRHGGRHVGFFRVSPSNNCKNRIFGGRTPPPYFWRKKVDSPLTGWRNNGILFEEVVLWPKERK